MLLNVLESPLLSDELVYIFKQYCIIVFLFHHYCTHIFRILYAYCFCILVLVTLPMLVFKNIRISNLFFSALNRLWAQVTYSELRTEK